MTTRNRECLESEVRKHKGPLRKPIDLLRRAMSSEDFVDSAVIGGVSMADILVGRIAEWQIPSDVIDAFHAQFPNHGSSFVEAVNDLAGDPDRLTGLINGVKGKVFELDYAKWLNHGHLPDGWTAELAHNANNPAWDISIHDVHGHVDDLFQLKATESLDYIRDAIAAHPDIDVVVPHEVYERLADHPELIGHIADGHETLSHISGHVADGIHHAESAGATSHLPFVGPVIAIGFMVGLNYIEYRRGKVTLEEALGNLRERGTLYMVSSAFGWAAVALAHEPFVGLPVSIAIRLLGGQFLHNRSRRELLQGYIDTVSDSRRHLAVQLQRPLLEGPTT